MLEGGGDLVNRLHPRPGGTATDENENVARPDRLGALPLDPRDRVALAREDMSRPSFSVHSVGVHYRGVDGGALDDRPFGREVTAGKRHGARQAAFARLRGAHDHVIWIDAVLALEQLAQVGATRADSPGFQDVAERDA